MYASQVRLYGALLKELGLLSKGDFLQCTPADLTGDAEGGCARGRGVGEREGGAEMGDEKKEREGGRERE